MSERRIGFIPRATHDEGKDCAVFVTDRRTILVTNEFAPKGLKASFKASLGPDADKLPNPRPNIDFATIDIDALAKMPGNLSFPHMSIEKMSIGRGIGGYGIWAIYVGEDNKKQYLLVTFDPPPALIERRKAEGFSSKETKKQYAIRCQQVYRKALPPIIAEKVDWKI